MLPKVRPLAALYAPGPVDGWLQMPAEAGVLFLFLYDVWGDRRALSTHSCLFVE